MTDLVYRLRKRAEIRRQVDTRKSVQEGKPDHIADLLEEAADYIEKHLAQEYDNMISELEREIGMVRARVKRLEQENAWLEETNVRLMQSNITKI
jgi:predicted nuclease with TOPRIM domain